MRPSRGSAVWALLSFVAICWVTLESVSRVRTAVQSGDSRQAGSALLTTSALGVVAFVCLLLSIGIVRRLVRPGRPGIPSWSVKLGFRVVGFAFVVLGVGQLLLAPAEAHRLLGAGAALFLAWGFFRVKLQPPGTDSNEGG